MNQTRVRTSQSLQGFAKAGLAFALTAGTAFAQTQANTPSSGGDAVDLFSDVVEVKVVNLEVVVADRSGNLVSGLQPEDFRIWVDGQEQTVDYFSEVQEGQALASDLDGPPAIEAGTSVGTNFLLYVDDNHTLKHRRDLVVRGLIEDLDRMAPKDRMAIVVQTGTELETLSHWSNDREQLRAALNELLDGKRFGGTFKSPLFVARRTSLSRGFGFADVEREFPVGTRNRFGSRLPSLSEARFLGNPTDTGELRGFDDFGQLNGQLQRIDLEFAMSGALSTLRGFDTPEGRKVMLMLTGKWPLGSFPEGISNFDTLTELDVVQPLIETANLMGYTLYPINDDATDSVFRNSSFNRVAQRTGGRTLFDRRDVLADAVADTRSYYWLGFDPELLGDNSVHDVVVEVMRPNLTVRARDSYVDLSRNAKLAMDTQGALLFGQELEDRGLEVVFGTPQPVRLRKMSVPVTVRIPLDEFTSLPIGGSEQIQLELRFAVVDASGSQANVPTIPVILRGDVETGDVYEHSTDLLMRRQPHKIIVAVHDPASGETLRTTSELRYRE